MNQINEFFYALRSLIKAEKVAETIDSTLDLVIDEGVFDGFPIVSYATATCRIKDNFHKAKLKRNIMAFKKALDSVDSQQVAKCIRQLNETYDITLDIADTMMSVFIDSEKPLKAHIMGRLFKALAEGDIDECQYNDALLIILSSSIVAINGLKKWFIATDGNPYALTGDDERDEQIMIPFLISMGVALHRGDEVFINEVGRNIYKYGITKA